MDFLMNQQSVMLNGNCQLIQCTHSTDLLSNFKGLLNSMIKNIFFVMQINVSCSLMCQNHQTFTGIKYHRQISPEMIRSIKKLTNKLTWLCFCGWWGGLFFCGTLRRCRCSRWWLYNSRILSQGFCKPMVRFEKDEERGGGWKYGEEGGGGRRRRCCSHALDLILSQKRVENEYNS